MKTRILSKVIPIVLTIVLLSSTAFATSSIITDFAGTGEMQYKDGKSLAASFNQPYGLVLDKEGSLIVVDSYNNCIRKVKDGIVTTIAGVVDKIDTDGFPTAGYVDGDVLKARFNHPRDAVVDSKGNIYVTDTGNNVIRKVSGSKVYTFAGTGQAGYADGKANAAKFNTPSGIAIDSQDNLYVADTLNQVIRKITQKGEVTTFAGKNSSNGGYKDGAAAEALFNEPSDVKIDKNGIIYILDSGNQLVRKVEKAEVLTIAGKVGKISEDTGYAPGVFLDGKAGEAGFNFPKGFDIAENGTIFIADTWNHRIRAISPGGTVKTIAGNGVPGKKDEPIPQSMLNSPVDVLYSSGTLYISDMWNNAIRVMKFDLSNIPDVSDKSHILEGIEFAPKSSEIQVWMDKQRVMFPDTKPYTANGKTYVPLRFVFEKWGAEVKYIPGGKVEVIKGMYYKVLSYSKDSIILKNHRMMIDTKTFSEITGFDVEYSSNNNAVVITT